MLANGYTTTAQYTSGAQLEWKTENLSEYNGMKG